VRVAALALGIAGVLALAQPRTEPAAAKPRVAVLAELFTSEGCSSCPPADDLLRRLIAEQPIDGIEIIGLSEHVDYWDRLGWKDPFSSPRFTERQNAYARTFRSERVYTPQLVIDGRLEVIGSDRAAVRRALADAARRARATVRVSASQPKGIEAATVHVSISDVPSQSAKSGALVVVAVVEDDLVSEVSRGENARKRLHHAAVTRAFEVAGRVAPGTTAVDLTHQVELNAAWRRDRLRVVAFVQHPRTYEVLGAAAAPFTAKRP
jgi:hypothetical protein